MKKHTDESFSSFYDGELGTEDEQMLNQLCQDQTLKSRWQRYQLVSETLRSNLPPAIDPDFSKNIMQAIAVEPAYVESESPSIPPTGHVVSIFSGSMGKRVAGFSIAATVAALAVASFQINYEQKSGVRIAESREVMMPVPQSKIEPPMQARLASVNPVVKNQQAPYIYNVSKRDGKLAPTTKTTIYPRLNKYLINHNQHFSGTQVQGVMPYARIVVDANFKLQKTQ